MGKRPIGSRLFGRISDYLVSGQMPDVICLQENPHGRDVISKYPKNAVYKIAQTKRGRRFLSNANTILSKFPILRSGEIGFSRRKDNVMQRILNGRDRHDCIWADIAVGDKVLRIYNCHLKLIATTAKDRLRAIEKVYKHAREAKGPVIVCGDMNTVLSHPNGLSRKIIRWFNEIEENYITHGKFQIQDERQGFRDKAEEYSFSDILDIKKPTFAIPYTSIELFKLKLDWILIRKMKALAKEYGPYISDHRPVRAIFEL